MPITIHELAKRIRGVAGVSEARVWEKNGHARIYIALNDGAPGDQPPGTLYFDATEGQLQVRGLDPAVGHRLEIIQRIQDLLADRELPALHESRVAFAAEVSALWAAAAGSLAKSARLLAMASPRDQALDRLVSDVVDHCRLASEDIAACEDVDRLKRLNHRGPDDWIKHLLETEPLAQAIEAAVGAERIRGVRLAIGLCLATPSLHAQEEQKRWAERVRRERFERERRERKGSARQSQNRRALAGGSRTAPSKNSPARHPPQSAHNPN